MKCKQLLLSVTRNQAAAWVVHGKECHQYMLTQQWHHTHACTLVRSWYASPTSSTFWNMALRWSTCLAYITCVHTHTERICRVWVGVMMSQQTFAFESILADICPSKMSWVSSSSRLETVVLKAVAIRCRSTLLNGLKYCTHTRTHAHEMYRERMYIQYIHMQCKFSQTYLNKCLVSDHGEEGLEVLWEVHVQHEAAAHVL